MRTVSDPRNWAAADTARNIVLDDEGRIVAMTQSIDFPADTWPAHAAMIGAIGPLIEAAEEMLKVLHLERECFHDEVSLPDGSVPDVRDAKELARLDGLIERAERALGPYRQEAVEKLAIGEAAV